MGAVGGEDVDAAGAGGEQVAIPVHLHPIRQAGELVHQRGRVVEHPALAERAVLFDRERHPDRSLRVRLRHVERLLIRREGDAVGAGHLLREEGKLAVFRQAVNAAEIEFPARIVEVFRQAVRGIGEVEVAV